MEKQTRALSSRAIRVVCAFALALMLIPSNAFGEMSAQADSNQEAAAVQADATTAGTEAAANTGATTGTDATNTDSTAGTGTDSTAGTSTGSATDTTKDTTADTSKDTAADTSKDSSGKTDTVINEPTTDTAAAQTALNELQSQADDNEIVPQADNGLTFKWVINDKWSGSGTDTNYTFTPSSTGEVAIQAQVGITSSKAYGVGEATFTISKTLLTYRDGSTCDIASLGVEAKSSDPDHDYGAAFWYYEDNGDGTYTFTNCKAIPSNDTKVFSITYKIDQGKVANGTVGEITPSKVTEGISASGCKVTFENQVTLKNFTKNVIKNGTGERKLPAAVDPSSVPQGSGYWFGHDSSDYNFNDNYYMIYRLDTTTSGSQPYYLTFRDELSSDDVDNGATILGMSTDSEGLHYCKTVNSTTSATDPNRGVGIYTVGSYDYDNNATEAGKTAQSVGTQYCYVMVQYPKANYTALKPGESLKFNNTATSSITDIDKTQGVTSDPSSATATWTKGAPVGPGGGDGSTKTVTADGSDGAVSVLKKGYDVDIQTDKLAVQNNYFTVEKDQDGNITKVNTPSHDAYAIDDTLQVYSSSNGTLKTLTASDYSLKSLSFDSNCTDQYMEYNAEEDTYGYVTKAADDANAGTFEIYGATSPQASLSDYSLITTRTYNEIKSGTNLTVDVSGANYVAFYVVYKGNTSAPDGKQDCSVSYNVYPTWTLKGSSTATWNTLAPNDTDTFWFANSAAFPFTSSATGKMFTEQESKDYTSSYMDTWNPNHQASAQIAADTTNFSSLMDSDRTGVGVPRSSENTIRSLTPIEGRSGTVKTSGKQTNDMTNSQVIIDNQQTGYEYYNITGLNLDQAIDKLSYKLSENTAVFDDLLPAGEKYYSDDNHPTTAVGTTNECTASVVAEPTDNYKGTGRQLVKFTVTYTGNTGTATKGNTYYPASTDGTSHTASGSSAGSVVGAGYLQSGFRVNYSTVVKWDAMNDVSAIPSDTAYQIHGTSLLGTAYADQVNMKTDGVGDREDVSPHDTIYVNNDKTEKKCALNNLYGDANYDETTLGDRKMDTVYSSLTTTVTADYAADSGLTKKVAPSVGTGAGEYVNDTGVEIGDDYTYKLTYNNSQYIQVTDLVLYDNFEQAGTDPKWQGTLKGIDTSVAESKGIVPVIYFSTEPNTSLDVHDGSWTKYDGTQDMSTFKAVAIDLTYTDVAQENKYTLPQLSNISATLTFTAPSSMELDDSSNTAVSKQTGKSYNSAGASLMYYITTGGDGHATTTSDPNKFTSVTLTDTRTGIALSKVDDTTAQNYVPGAQFKLEAELSSGDWAVLSADDVWSATADDVTAAAAKGITISEGDIVYGNADYTPAADACKTPLKLYASGSIYGSDPVSGATITYTGNYKLTEIAAPDGYQVSSPDETDITVTAAATEGDDPTVTITPAGSTEALPTKDGKSQITDPKIDVSIAKELKSTAIDDNGNVTYTITLHNNKEAAVTDYKVADTMTGLTYVSSSATGATVTYDAATGTFTVDKILAANDDNYEDVVITVVCKVTDDKFTNQVEPTTNPEAKSDKVRVDADGSDTAATDTVKVGDKVYYKVTVDNTTGTAALAAGYKTTETFTGLRYVGTDAAVTSNTDGSLTWTTTADVAAGETTSIWLPFIVEPTVTGDGATVDTSIINNSANGTAVGEKVANVTQTKEMTTKGIADDGTVTYKITLSNSGAIASDAYDVTDTMTNLEYVSHTATGATVTKTSTGFKVDSVPMGNNSVVITVIAKPTADTFSNALGPIGTADPTDSKVRTDENGNPATDQVIPGQTVYYKLSVDNTATDAKDQTGYTMTDTFTGMSYTGTVDGVVDNGDGTLTWTTDVSKGATAEVILPFKIDKTDAAGESTTLISNKANNVVVSEKIPNVGVVKDLVTPADEVGGTATYTLTLSNTGSADATNFKVSDFMTNLTYDSSSVVTGSATATWTGDGFTVDNVPVGEDTVVIMVKCTTTDTTYTNAAKVTGDTEPTLTKSRVDADGNPATDAALAGSTVYYKITYDNSKGETDVESGKTFTDKFDGLTYVSYTGDGMVSADGTTWTAPKVNAGESASVIMEFTVNDDVTSFTNRVVADDGSGSAVVSDQVGEAPVDNTKGATAAKTATVKTGDNTPFGSIALLLAGGVTLLVYSRRRAKNLQQ